MSQKRLKALAFLLVFSLACVPLCISAFSTNNYDCRQPIAQSLSSPFQRANFNPIYSRDGGSRSNVMAGHHFQPQQQRRRQQKNSRLFIGINGASNKSEEQRRIDEREVVEPSMLLLALAPPILGFIVWGDISKGVSYFFDMFNNFQSVDGNSFAADILRPTINGIVVPAASIVLGTLFATTVNVLWNRQLQIRFNINKEVGELRLLRRALFGCYGTAQHSKRRSTALGLVHGYTQTLIRETQVDCIPWLKDIQEKQGISSNEMDELADMLHGVDGAAASRESSVASAESLLVSLNTHRSERVATTLSDFPVIHWMLLIFLYSTINISFFIDSNQGVLQYLNSLQLRVLFALILGVGSGSAVLLRGLDDPFQGPFSIRLSARQLDYFEDLLKNDIMQANEELQEVGQCALVSLERKQERPQYGTGNTILFHLLTGPWAGPVKVIGEGISWVTRRLKKTLQGIVDLWRPSGSDNSVLA